MVITVKDKSVAVNVATNIGGFVSGNNIIKFDDNTTDGQLIFAIKRGAKINNSI